MTTDRLHQIIKLLRSELALLDQTIARLAAMQADAEGDSEAGASQASRQRSPRSNLDH